MPADVEDDGSLLRGALLLRVRSLHAGSRRLRSNG